MAPIDQGDWSARWSDYLFYFSKINYPIEEVIPLVVPLSIWMIFEGDIILISRARSICVGGCTNKR